MPCSNVICQCHTHVSACSWSCCCYTHLLIQVKSSQGVDGQLWIRLRWPFQQIPEEVDIWCHSLFSQSPLPFPRLFFLSPTGWVCSMPNTSHLKCSCQGFQTWRYAKLNWLSDTADVVQFCLSYSARWWGRTGCFLSSGRPSRKKSLRSKRDIWDTRTLSTSPYWCLLHMWLLASGI